MSVRSVAEVVQEASESELGMWVNIELVKNPRSDGTMIEEFSVNISVANTILDWKPEQGIHGLSESFFRRYSYHSNRRLL